MASISSSATLFHVVLNSSYSSSTNPFVIFPTHLFYTMTDKNSSSQFFNRTASLKLVLLLSPSPQNRVRKGPLPLHKAAPLRQRDARERPSVSVTPLHQAIRIGEERPAGAISDPHPLSQNHPAHASLPAHDLKYHVPANHKNKLSEKHLRDARLALMFNNR